MGNRVFRARSNPPKFQNSKREPVPGVEPGDKPMDCIVPPRTQQNWLAPLAA